MKHLKEKILWELEHHENTRDCDIKLTNSIWVDYYRDKLIIELIDGKEHYLVRLVDLYELPSVDDVKRIRAVIQNKEHKFLPTSEAVRKKRRIGEELWRDYLGYNPEFRTAD